jgi:hypothetical protein
MISVPLMFTVPAIVQEPCTSHTTGVFAALGVKDTVTPEGMLTDVY